jgi:hypothetical protein
MCTDHRSNRPGRGLRGAAAQAQRPRICATGVTGGGWGTSGRARGCRLSVHRRWFTRARQLFVLLPQKVRTRPLSVLPHGNIGLLTGADLLLLFLQVAFCRLYALLLFCLCFLEIAILDTCFIFSRMGRGLRVSAG